MEDHEIEDIKPQNQIIARIQDRIKLLKHRCEAGLGNNLAEKIIAILRQKSNIYILYIIDT